MAEHVRKVRKQPIRTGANRDVAIAAANGLIRREESMRRSERFRRRALREVFRRFPDRERESGLE